MKVVWMLVASVPILAQRSDLARIIGGSDAQVGRYEYMASMAIKGSHQCGGSLIAPDVILTAAHCVGYFSEVILGQYNLSDNFDPYESYIAQSIVTHPESYRDESKDSDPYDFALVKIYGETQISPIRINRNPDVPTKMGDQLVVIGWGATVFGGDAVDVLQMATVDYIPNDVCKNITGDVNGVPTTMESQVIDVTLCASDFANGQDACQGDSGGPILIQGSDASEDLLVGLTSSGIDGCADGIFPGLYARTSAAIRWIDEELCQLSSKPPADFNCPNVTRLPVTSTDNVNVTIEIDLDRSPSDLGWIVQSTNEFGVNVTYASRPFFTYSSTNTVTVVESIKLPNNQAYTFILLDLGNDGMCCDSGGLRIYQGTSAATATAKYLSANSSMLNRYAAIPFDFTVGRLPTQSPTMTPAPSSTSEPSVQPSSTRPFISIQIVFDEYPQHTGWIVEALLDNEVLLIDVRYPGFYRKFSAGTSFTERVELLPYNSSGPIQYRFTMTDNENNGLCCANGSGSARVYMGDVSEKTLLFEFTKFFLEDERLFTDEQVNLAPSSSGAATHSAVLWHQPHVALVAFGALMQVLVAILS